METTDDPLDDPAIARRVEVLTHLRDGTIDLGIASRLLGVSERQVRRLLDTWLGSGAIGLVHGNRGRSPANRTDEVLRARIIELAGSRYAGGEPGPPRGAAPGARGHRHAGPDAPAPP